jgi:predicted nucleic-acid-binding Zn-ribbon protein
MWPFRRKQTSKYIQQKPPCPYCKSNNTKVISSLQATGETNFIKTWRSQRYIPCRCSECGRDFYIEATSQNIVKTLPLDGSIIEDEDELMTAEEELKRQADEENDHRFRGNM